jgi:uncharacterized protein
VLIFELMNRAEADAIVDAVSWWAIERDDIRAMALLGSWARGSQRKTSDVDLLLLTDQTEEYLDGRTWLAQINFRNANYAVQSSDCAVYGEVWSRHVHLLPAAEVELTFARCSWAKTNPIDCGTRSVVKDAFRIIFDKDGSLAMLADAVMSG